MPKDKDSFIHRTPRKALIGLNTTRFLELLDDSNLSEYLNEDQKITLLAPPNESMDVLYFEKDRASWLKYHMIHGRYEPDQLTDGLLLPTESHDALGREHNQHIYVSVSENTSGKSIQFGQAQVLGDPGNSFLFCLSLLKLV
jgi:uncharacterized surface protein with fasciclin (FAS1) repeats